MGSCRSVRGSASPPARLDSVAQRGRPLSRTVGLEVPGEEDEPHDMCGEDEGDSRLGRCTRWRGGWPSRVDGFLSAGADGVEAEKLYAGGDGHGPDRGVGVPERAAAEDRAGPLTPISSLPFRVEPDDACEAPRLSGRRRLFRRPIGSPRTVAKELVCQAEHGVGPRSGARPRRRSAPDVAGPAGGWLRRDKCRST